MKLLYILILVTLSLSGYAQINKALVKTIKYAGTYSYGQTVKRNFGTILIYPETDSTILFYLNVNRGAPSYHLGTLYARVKIINGEGMFFSNAFSETGCGLKFKFIKNILVIETIDGQFDCGFGVGVFADGKFNKKSTKIPEYFDEYGKKIYFKKISPEEYYK